MGNKELYFLGIGGIGMSALARYYIARGYEVWGYDLVESAITKELQELGAIINFIDSVDQIPKQIKENSHSVVIYTPAIPKESKQLNWFKAMGYTTLKRSEALGAIVKEKRVIAIAGTHGKSSITTMVAHILTDSKVGCTAFLGGISLNYNSNLIDSGGDAMVVEADEFDRSFHRLWPEIAVVTSTDPDHLDIYESESGVIEAYRQFANQISLDGALIIKKGCNQKVTEGVTTNIFNYSLSSDAHFYATSIEALANGLFSFTINYPGGAVPKCSVGIPGRINIENGVAAFAAAFKFGVEPQKIANALSTFKGVKRRFEKLYHLNNRIYIDDYAHHPNEVRCSINSIRDIAPQNSLTVIFQPHLYSRTRDFAKQFAEALSLADQVILLDIYPAREKPIEGVSSEMLLEGVECKKKFLSTMEGVVELLKEIEIESVVTMGAGNIEKLREPIVNYLKELNG